MLVKEESSRIETSEFYGVYVKHREAEENPLEKRQFTIELERLGCRRVKVKNHMLPQGVKEYVPEEKENRAS